jgi:hypothetical protein
MIDTKLYDAIRASIPRYAHAPGVQIEGALRKAKTDLTTTCTPEEEIIHDEIILWLRGYAAARDADEARTKSVRGKRIRKAAA